MDHSELPLPTKINSVGVILAIVAGSLSFLSSCTIMTTIFRSKQNTQYHRIMFFISFWDSISSLCILLVTLPMPSNVSDVYDYGGASSFGSLATCSAQGFLLLLGLGMCVLGNIFLNVYYLSSIRYNVSDERFKKIAEPCFFLFTPLAMVLPVTLLWHDMFNPTPYEPFCLYGEYPHKCRQSQTIECIRDAGYEHNWVKDFYFEYSMIFISSLMGFLFLSMVVIVYTVCTKKVDINEDENNGYQEYKKTESKIITWQALMYLTACLIVWLSSILSWVVPFFETAYLFFMPLQGFLNLLIFMYHKVYVLTKVTYECDNWKEALLLILKSPKDAATEGQLVGNIDMVMDPSRQIANLQHAIDNIVDNSNTSGYPDANEQSQNQSSIKSHDLSIQNQSSRGGGATNLSGFSYMSNEYKTVVDESSEAQNNPNLTTESFMDDNVSYGQSKASHLISTGSSYGQHSDKDLKKK
ncbi:hypothetical protein CTEN210_18564 [Chaetoceros tenuissimus]|uniref:G-protein coupled receptors family 1 profile domain-containing protein n=1 Tax=Chaetoceros tenuissimus TaxID=426638 RepID=A0AAD3HGF0_9STRA|nr:hypothetical protein CTEN210_18564 [Chaetoceros tenuissimus]